MYEITCRYAAYHYLTCRSGRSPGHIILVMNNPLGQWRVLLKFVISYLVVWVVGWLPLFLENGSNDFYETWQEHSGQ